MSAMTPDDIFMIPGSLPDPRLLLDPDEWHTEDYVRQLCGFSRAGLAWARRHNRLRWVANNGRVEYLGRWLIEWVEREEDRSKAERLEEYAPSIWHGWQCWVANDDDGDPEDGQVGRLSGWQPRPGPAPSALLTLADILPRVFLRLGIGRDLATEKTPIAIGQGETLGDRPEISEALQFGATIEPKKAKGPDPMSPGSGPFNDEPSPRAPGLEKVHVR